VEDRLAGSSADVHADVKTVWLVRTKYGFAGSGYALQ
jgi:hypothetical protein